MKEPPTEDLGESISQFAFTPSKVLLFSKSTLSNLLSQREDILIKMDAKIRLAYELRNAIKNEDYEFASSLREKFNSLKEEET